MTRDQRNDLTFWGTILALAMQLGGLVWFLSAASERLAAVEEQVAPLSEVIETINTRLVTVEQAQRYDENDRLQMNARLQQVEQAVITLGRVDERLEGVSRDVRDIQDDLRGRFQTAR